ncbi:unnamed protein product [Coffea canephora]|uniref:DNA replication checkpoint mediator MRC1 domain-containing protein n=1 Tax=Coffea canephora TaxID=49390 RepID=A0A068UGC1_COFCA|nr:unnamed protein product [Coffea canephora]
MDSDDDYQSFPPLQPSPQPQNRRLKRLKKKATEVSSKPPSPQQPDSLDPLLGIPRVDFARLEALEASATKTLDSFFDDSNESPLPSHVGTEMESEGNIRMDSEELDSELAFEKDNRTYSELASENNNQMDAEMALEKDSREAKRALEFDDVADVEQDRDSKSEKFEKKRDTTELDVDNKTDEMEEDSSKKKKSKRTKNDTTTVDDDMKSKVSASDKRRQEKERKTYLKQLHAESQRLLRETTEAAFKPIPVVNKPISSVLEKIRQRKRELSKKNLILNNNAFAAANGGVRRDDIGYQPTSRLLEEREDKLAKAVEDIVACPVLPRRDALDVDKSDEPPVPSSREISPPDEASSEESSPMFRAPIDDTQDLFGDSETKECNDELPGGLQDSPLEEVMAPSLLAMNLKFDSVPSNDSSSEEDNDKENTDPLPHGGEDDSISPRGAPFKAFLDEEAEEEDDSDNELLQSKETEEDEDMEDSEELNDIIATEYEERPIDCDRRNELHQKWLEQQDEAGTDNLLQRLKVGLEPKETALVGEEQEEIEDGEDFNDEDVIPRNYARMNTKKAKQIITQMFLDKDDSFISDEDEEVERRRVKQHLLVRAEEQATLVSPMEDESSREVFGLIKKLNIVPENKKKAKASSYFDSELKGGQSRSFAKSSFIGRSSYHSLPSSHKQGSGTVRSFIFGRDDSNSRSSISKSDDSLDTISKEKPMRTVTATVTSSQAKFSSQYRSASGVRATGASLFETLKRSSIRSMSYNRDDAVDLSHVLATFRVPKKPIKIEGRN